MEQKPTKGRSSGPLHTPAGKYKIITFLDGFHGRTFGAVTATAQPKYHEGIGPMLPGFLYAPRNDLAAVRKLIDEETAAIMIEPVQGEGGVNIPAPGFLKGLRELCDEFGLLLIFDEVQTCNGRTGTGSGIRRLASSPTSSRSPRGSPLVSPAARSSARTRSLPACDPGMHASTFGGNPIAMAAGLATIQMIEEENLLAHSRQMSERFRQHFTMLKDELPLDSRTSYLQHDDRRRTGRTAVPAVGKCMEKGC